MFMIELLTMLYCQSAKEPQSSGRHATRSVWTIWRCLSALIVRAIQLQIRPLAILRSWWQILEPFASSPDEHWPLLPWYLHPSVVCVLRTCRDNLPWWCWSAYQVHSYLLGELRWRREWRQSSCVLLFRDVLCLLNKISWWIPDMFGTDLWL